MKGVDHSDQLLSYLPLARRTAKWTTKLFMHMLTFSVVQASIIMNKCRAARAPTLRPIKLTDFVFKLGCEMTKELVATRGTRYRSVPKEISKPGLLLRLDHNVFHYLGKFEGTETAKKPRKQCKVCYDRCAVVPGKRKRGTDTYVRCVPCDIPLCLEPCFYIFHQKIDYTEN